MKWYSRATHWFNENLFSTSQLRHGCGSGKINRYAILAIFAQSKCWNRFEAEVTSELNAQYFVKWAIRMSELISINAGFASWDDETCTMQTAGISGRKIIISSKRLHYWLLFGSVKRKTKVDKHHANEIRIILIKCKNARRCSWMAMDWPQFKWYLSSVWQFWYG